MEAVSYSVWDADHLQGVPCDGKAVHRVGRMHGGERRVEAHAAGGGARVELAEGDGAEAGKCGLGAG